MKILAANILWALSYLVAGYLGLLFALPPSNASPIWPAAGVALAAILIHGNRVIPGLFAGAFASQFLSYLDPSSSQTISISVIIAQIIALGSVLQAWAGSKFIKRYVGQNDPLIHDRQIIRFFLLGGPISCLICASIGSFTLLSENVINSSEFLLTWGTWWTGDTIGVLLVTPVLMIFLARPRATWRIRIKSVVLPLLVLLVMVILLFEFGKQQDMDRISNEFARQSRLLSNTLQDRIFHHVEINRQLKAFFDNTDSVTEEKFTSYSRAILDDKTTVQAVEWAPRVKASRLDDFLQEWPGVSTLWEREGDDLVPVQSRREYIPIRYLFPKEGNERALGFDIASNPVARDALIRARDTGRTAVTAPTRLVQDMDYRIGSVLYSPVYSTTDKLLSIEQRREKLLGYAVSVFRVEDEINYIFSDFSDIQLDVSVYDGNTPVFKRKNEHPRHDLGNINLEDRYEMSIADKSWLVTIVPSPEFFRNELYWHTWWLLLGGLLITVFAGAGLMMMTGRTMRTELLVKLRTSELESEISQRLQVMDDKERQNYILRTVVSSAPLEEVLNIIARVTETSNPDMRCSILLLDEDGKHVRHVAAPGLPLFFINAIDGSEIGPKAGSCGTAIFRRRRVIVEDISRDPLWENYRELALKAGLKACWSEPIIGANRQVLGSFAIYYEEPRVPDREDLQKIEDLSQLASIAIERKQKESQIQRLAFFDVLTDLPNRRLLQDRLQQELASVKRNDTHGALIFIDLDNFKHLNDSLGHQVGDKLLLKVATRLKKCIRDEDTAARLGGDEFIILLRNTDSDIQRVTEHANVLAQRIKSELNNPFNLDGYTHHISPSIGITFFSRENSNLEEILKQADTAMYSAKARGKNTICYYHPDMQKKADRRLQIEKDLRRAVDKKQFSLHYQPQYNEHLEIVSVEALLRWQHPLKGLIPPDEFIPVAEESELILKIGEYVIEQVCRQLARWPGLDYISINISPSQLQQTNFVDRLKLMLSQFGVPGHRLMLEMTESMMITDMGNALEKLRAIQEHGIGISIDDFGTGYSSLVYLKTLPINQLKIDKGFIHDIVSDPDDRMIVETIISMAHHLRLDVIAEGVETEEQLQFLRKNNCNAYQGYYFNKAMPAEELEPLLLENPDIRKSGA